MTIGNDIQVNDVLLYGYKTLITKNRRPKKSGLSSTKNRRVPQDHGFSIYLFFFLRKQQPSTDMSFFYNIMKFPSLA